MFSFRIDVSTIMERPTQPSEIAREAIKKLASRKLPPTPENFRRMYAEVQGKEIDRNAWPEAIKSLLAQWETYQSGLTQTKKREMLERVLINFGADPDQLVLKLSALARSWREAGLSGAVVEDDADLNTAPQEDQRETPSAAAKQQEAPAPGTAETGEASIGRALAQALDELAAASDTRWSDLAARARALGRAIAERGFSVQEGDIAALAAIWREWLVRAEDDEAYVAALKRLLSLLFENLSELVADEAWFSGQLSALRAAISGELNAHALFEVESHLRDVIARQKALKGSLIEAREKLKALISTFVNRVGELSDSTGNFHLRIEEYSQRVAHAEDIGELAVVIDALSADMLRMRDDMRRTHTELIEARHHVEEAQARIQALERELEEVSSLVREDQLTGALNRRGMEEAFAREEARAERLHAPFTLGLLDIDHFKRLNDTLGHQAGDQALVHLARIVRRMLRPTDTLARYGGEEFLILFPNTDLHEAQRAMQRIQRELTREIFMHEHQRILITFSAGVAQRRPGETRDSLIARADAAMYRAKSAGRNRVECAD